MRWRILVVATIIGVAALLPALSVAQEGTRRAGLVLRFGDGRVVERCINFSEESISAEDLLARSGLPLIVQSGGVGSAVCKIDGEGCDYPAQNCFCQCQGGDCRYWAFQRLVEGSWRYSNQGASQVRVADGDVHGWAWGAGSVQSGSAPPLRSLAQLCDLPSEPVPAPEAQPATPTALPPEPPPASATVPPATVPQPTATPRATQTSAPTLAATLAASATMLPPTETVVAPTETVAASATTQRATATPAQVALVLPTEQPAAAATQTAPQNTSPPGGYLALAVLLLLLLTGIVVQRAKGRR